MKTKDNANTKPPVILITTGEPAGIGPDLAVRLASQRSRWRGMRLVLVGDATLLERRALRLGLPWRVQAWQDEPQTSFGIGDSLAKKPVPSPTFFHASPPLRDGVVEVLHIPLRVPSKPGILNPENADYVLDTLDWAIGACHSGAAAAMVTAPVHKGVIRLSGTPAGKLFTGHTEYLANYLGVSQPVMLLVGGKPLLRVALATTHLPLREVSEAITFAGLQQVLRALNQGLREQLGIPRARILVAGLNPHAGEGGQLGTEEQTIIIPALEGLQREGLLVSGPLPADTLFTPAHLSKADAVLALYHDQGLSVLKYASFGHAVNITLGLPIIRTSVDHGTAIDLARTAEGAIAADEGSLRAALETAMDLVRRAKPRDGKLHVYSSLEE